MINYTLQISTIKNYKNIVEELKNAHVEYSTKENDLLITINNIYTIYTYSSYITVTVFDVFDELCLIKIKHDNIIFGSVWESVE